MNSSVLTAIWCAILFVNADSMPRWSWGKFANIKSLSEESKQVDDCVNGECVKAVKCPQNATVQEETPSCSKRSDGPWVCCAEHLKNTSIQYTGKSAETTKSVLELILNKTKDSDATDLKLLNMERGISTESVNDIKEDNILPPPEPMEYRYNADIVNWRRNRAHSPKHSPTEDTSINIERKSTDRGTWGNSFTSSPFSRVTGDKGYSRASTERNKNIPDVRYDPHMERSRTTVTGSNIRHGLDDSKRSNSNWIVKTTPRSWWISGKESWNKNSTPNKRTKPSEEGTTARSWGKPSPGSWEKTSNVRKSSKTWDYDTTPRSWMKPTKELWNRDHSSSSERSTKPCTRSTTAKSWVKPTKESWGYTSSSERNNRTYTRSTTLKSWVKPTMESWGYTSSPERNTIVRKTNITSSLWVRPTKQSWNWGSASNPERKSTKTTQGSHGLSTRKPTSNIHREKSRRTSVITKVVPKVTPAYPERQTVRNHASSLSTRSNNLSTKRPWTVSVENIETGKSSRTTRPTPVNRRSSTKKHIPTTPLPDVNIHMCGMRGMSIESSRRGKRSPEKESHTEFVGVLNDRSPFQRIVGGKEAEPFSWPWVAALYKVTESGGNSFLSAGTLINENFVLTAAHVFTPQDLRSSSFAVMLGTHTAKEAVAEYHVMFVLRHPDYRQRYYYNDIALLRLARPVAFNNYVMPVCLPSPSLPLIKEKDLVGKRATVMGWGDESYGGKTSRVLREASFPIVSRGSCNASYFRVASNRFPRGITSNMLCAGSPDGGKDACQGDSGGPLTVFENGRYTQVGIVSFGYACGDKEYPGVYTKVATYLRWIAENARCDGSGHGYPHYYYR